MSATEMFWSQKYRPKTVEDCILPKALYDSFSNFVKRGSVPNLLLSGSQGTGKTTVAKALCEQLGYDYIVLNGSNEGRMIDTLRTRITNFASSMSMVADRKCVILDEADGIPTLVQEALRQFIEEYSANCSFIFTANFKNRLIQPLHSRCTVIDFKVSAEERQEISLKFFKRMCFILTENNIQFEKAAVAGLVNKFFPDWRRCINELQRYSATGKIDTGILATLENADVAALVGFIKTKNFKSAHEWVFTQPSIDMAQLCRDLATELRQIVKPEFFPGLYVSMADYQFKHTVAIDPQVNIIAMIAVLMMELEFK